MDFDREWREAIRVYASRVDVPDTLVTGAIAGARDRVAERRRKRRVALTTVTIIVAMALPLAGGTVGYVAGLDRAVSRSVTSTGTIPDTAVVKATIAAALPAELAPADTTGEITATGAFVVTAHLGGEQSSAVMTVTVETNGVPTPAAGIGRWLCITPGCTVHGVANGAVLMTTDSVGPDGTTERWAATLGRPDGSVIDVSLSLGDGVVGRAPPFAVQTLALIAFQLNW